MEVLLNLFFDDYGLPTGWWWVFGFLLSIICTVAAYYTSYYYKIITHHEVKRMKLTRQEKRILENLGYYSCFGLNYPVDKKRKILKFWIILSVAGIPLLLVSIWVSFIYIFAFIIMLFIGDNNDHTKVQSYYEKYIHEYTLLKQENPSLTVEAFAESIKVFLAAQEKQRTQQEKREAEQERAELKQKYDL